MNNDQMNNDQLQEDLTEVLRVRRDKLTKLQEMGRDPFKVSRYDRTSNSTEIKGNFEEFEGKIVKIAGRIMSKRIQGKAGFIDITPDSSPPNTPARHIDFSVFAIIRSAALRVRSTPSRVTNFSPSSALRTTTLPPVIFDASNA